MNLIAGVAISAGICTILIGSIPILFDRKQYVRWVFFATAFGLGGWSIDIGLLTATQNIFFNQFIFYAGIPAFGGLLLLSLSYPDRSYLPIMKYVYLLPLLPIALFASTGAFVSGIAITDGTVSPINGPLMPLFTAISAGYILASIIIFISRLSRSSGRARAQLAYLLFGIFLAFGTILLGDIFLPTMGTFALVPLGPLSLILFTGLVAYAIVRHNLLDVKIVIQRSLIYSLLLAIVICSYLGLVSLLDIALGNVQENTLISAGLTTILGIFGVPFIEKYFRRWTDRFFFKERPDYPAALRLMGEILDGTLDIEVLLSKTEERLARILRAKSVSISLYPIAESTDSIPASGLTTPIAIDGRIAGRIVVGAKLSGDTYSSEDERFLQTVAYHAATAFSRAFLYSKVKRHAQELEQKVRERTAELKVLQESQKQMMLDISHNLQTPLTVFKTRIESLKRTLPELPEVDHLGRSIESISAFIYDLLRLARLEELDPKEDFSDTDLSAIVAEAVEEIETIASERGISVRATITPSLIVRGDAKALREVVMNIAGNCVKYMRETGDRSIVILFANSADGAELIIRDTGIGIQSHELPMLFSRFYRATNNPSRGTGLGLSIAKSIIEQHRGTINVESTFGEGTTMIVRLPLLP